MMNDATATWIAKGKSFLKEAEKSAKSFNKHHDIETVLITTHKDYKANEYFSKIVYGKCDDKKSWSYNFIKLRQLMLDLNDKIFMIDTDCYFCKNIKPMYDALEWFDIVGSLAPRRTVSTIYEGSEAYSELNGGFMAFKTNKKVKEFLRKWLEYFEKYDGIYQGSLQEPMRDVLLNWDGRVGYLPQSFNFRWPFGGRVHGPVYVLHGRILHGKEEDYEKLAKKVNQNPKAIRAWNKSELP